MKNIVKKSLFLVIAVLTTAALFGAGTNPKSIAAGDQYFSAYKEAKTNLSSNDWVSTSGSPGNSSTSYTAPDGWLPAGSGQDGYGLMTVQSAKTITFTVKNITSVSILGAANSAARSIILSVKESGTEVGTAASTKGTSIQVIDYASTLDATKTYSVTVSASDGNNAKFYQIKFVGAGGSGDQGGGDQGGGDQGGGDQGGGDQGGGDQGGGSSSYGYDEIIKVVLSGDKASVQTVTGTIGGTSAVNKLSNSSAPYKLNNDDQSYASIVLNSGYYYEATDTLIITGCNKAMQVYYGTAGSGILLLTTGAPTNGVIKTLLTGLPANQNSIYVYRASSTYNGTLTSMAVHRPKSGPTLVTGVTLNKTATSIEQGQTETLTATVSPDNADNQAVSWSSSDPAVANVDENGVVSALSAGTANITVTTEDGGHTASCTVTVTAPAVITPVTAIDFNKNATTLAIGDSETLTVLYEPADANTGKAITSWVSDDETVATVDNGTITGVAAGTATITATSQGGFTATCTVTVVPVVVTGVTLNKTSLTLKEEGFESLTATVAPSNATNKDITWSSSDPNVATVDANGKVTGVAEGTATITVTTEDGNKTAYCTVTVEAKSQSAYTAHTPEIYEDPAGYNTPLVVYNNRDYEVYYVTRDPSGSNICIATTTDDKIAGISTGTATTVKARDNWFELLASNGKGGDSNASAKDEFQKTSVQSFKMQAGHEMIFQVKGFDQFSFYGKDNNQDASKGRQFEVYIDGTKVSGAPVDGYAIHRYDMSSAEHTIRLTAIGTQDNKLTGFSLRVSNDPIVRHLKGPKQQTVYQTKAIERVAFRVRRAASHRITWVNDNAIPGVSMVDGLNDSVFVEGIADAAPGVYTYKIEALDAAGNVASSETGKITIQTHVFETRNMDFTTNIGEAIKPLNFIYYAASSDSISLQWNGVAISGLDLAFSQDSIATLSGTPAATNPGGTYTYSIVAAGGNSVSGTITLVVPDPYFGAYEEVKVKDNRHFSFSIPVYHVASIESADKPDWITGTYDEQTGLLTFSGTPNVGGPYSKTVTFTVTALPKYAGKQAVSATVTIIVIDPNMQTILLVCKNLASADDDPIASYLKKDFDVTLRKQDMVAGSSLEAFDLILISENVDADHAAVLALVKSAPKPLLNMKAFTYVYMRDEDTPNGWGEADNGSLSANGQSITIRRPDHPIIQSLNMNMQYGQTLEILSSINKKGLMPINIFQQGTYCIATALTRSKADYNGDGEMQTFLHEEPAALRGGNKYICLPIALSSSANLTLNGKKLVDAVVDYLLSDEQAVLEEIPLHITSFSIDGVEGVIEEDLFEGFITVDIDTVAHPGINLRKVAPVVTVASEYSHVIPLSGDTVDLSWSGFMPVAYVVTDYINRFVYHVSVNLYAPQGLEDAVYEPGMWVNIFDIYGRKVTTTNDNIRTIDLPRGIYIVITENGHSLKIMR